MSGINSTPLVITKSKIEIFKKKLAPFGRLAILGERLHRCMFPIHAPGGTCTYCTVQYGKFLCTYL